MVIKTGLATKVFRVLEILKLLYYPMAPSKTEYLIIIPNIIVPPEPL